MVGKLRTAERSILGRVERERKQYINITDPCISYVNYVNQKEQKKNNSLF